LIGDEMQRRFGNKATIEYIDTGDPEQRAAHETDVQTIQERGLIYPVTFVDDEAVYDGAVSYPGILRAVEVKLTAVA
jgi:disulfide oxidoreductase YuzD